MTHLSHTYLAQMDVIKNTAHKSKRKCVQNRKRFTKADRPLLAIQTPEEVQVMENGFISQTPPNSVETHPDGARQRNVANTPIFSTDVRSDVYTVLVAEHHQFLSHPNYRHGIQTKKMGYMLRLKSCLHTNATNFIDVLN